MATPNHSFWSMHHDNNELSYQLVREGWAVEWPRRDHTAVIDTYDDLLTLCRTYPCTVRHLDVDHLLPPELYTRFGSLDHSAMYQPPLDYAALADAGYDAVYLSPKGFEATRFTEPGTQVWDCPTVLWLTPTFEPLHPITTQEFTPPGFFDALMELLKILPADAPGTPAES